MKYNELIRNTELWHMKYGCSAPSTLYQTQKHVDGMPQVLDRPRLFKCPYCTKAKLVKRGGGKLDPREIIVPNQALHMDLAFVSGPSNLKEIIQTGAKPRETVKKSREGHIGFLTIINVASRYLWVFPIKNKSPPIDIINKFLKKYGIKTGNKIITTTPQGYLSKSKLFKDNATSQDYSIQDMEMDDLFDINTSCLLYTSPSPRDS